MSEGLPIEQGNDPQEGGTGDKLFTQEEVNSLVGQARLKERGKYRDYDKYKAAFDEQGAMRERMSDLESRLDTAESERDALKTKAQRDADVAAVAGEKGLPASLIFGDTPEQMAANADAILAHIESLKPKGNPLFRDAGAPVKTGEPSAMGGFAKQLFKKE